MEILTFTVADRKLGIDVTKVQEIIQGNSLTKVHLSSEVVSGLFNLRGRVITSINLHSMIGLFVDTESMELQIVCNFEGTVVSFSVEDVGDVVVASENSILETPNHEMSRNGLFQGVYTGEDEEVWILDTAGIRKVLDQSIAS